ncbi:MAG: TolC family protein [Pirellulaceae bacterium]
MPSPTARLVLLLLGLNLLATFGCSRTKYRLNADQDAYCVLQQKTLGTPWSPEMNYSVYPRPDSRLYDPSCVDDPALPVPAPQLYAYNLPALPQRDPARFKSASPERARETDQANQSQQTDPNRFPSGRQAESAKAIDSSPATEQSGNPESTIPDAPEPPSPPADPTPSVLTPPDNVNKSSNRFKAVSYQSDKQPDNQEAITPLIASDNSNVIDSLQQEDEDAVSSLSDDELLEDTVVNRKRPIPEDYWAEVPIQCLRRMIEFDTVIAEYKDTFTDEPSDALFDDSPRLSLEDIIELTLLNSRELQSQKEALYRSALGLTLERFDYQLRPSFGNNGTAVNYSHNRNGGLTVNNLSIPTNFQLQRMLYTGGDFLARFANSVLLTFNGPQGFSSDVSSELLFSFSQAILQRDVQLENLTQAERNVVYAARDYMRFRKQLFVSQASRYYSLIRQYRQIEIESQNYFTLVREFNQREEEFNAGQTSRIQVDQIEQQVINGRRGLLSTCTNLENSMDDLKLQIGLPTEQMINLDLTELQLLTLRDELAVNSELIDRVRKRLNLALSADEPSQATLLSTSTSLIERMLDSIRIREELEDPVGDAKPLRELLILTQIETARIVVREANADLDEELNSESSNAETVLQRRMNVLTESANMLRLQLELINEIPLSDQAIAEAQALYDPLVDRIVDLSRELRGSLTEMDEHTGRTGPAAEALQRDVAMAVESLDQAIGIDHDDMTAEEELQQTVKLTNELLSTSSSFLISETGGLVPVEIDMDDAMMTALVQRFDLMNERGTLADDWRQIKYAGDDLRSVLNLQASQSIRTRRDVNRPFNFTFDESTTSLRLQFDAPLNRQAQRNNYRNTLINYQASLRRLMQLEDTIKLEVRRDLRALALGREQYVNDIASAALAYERVVSTELELRLGIGNVASRDFLEAQNSYINALSNVASQHISYVVDRLNLFLDLESLTVDDTGLWPQMYEEQLQPLPAYQFPDYALPAYGSLHPCLKYSKCIRRMEQVPPGVAMIHRTAEQSSQDVTLGDVTVPAANADAADDVDVSPELVPMTESVAPEPVPVTLDPNDLGLVTPYN